jgi:ribosome-associated protein
MPTPKTIDFALRGDFIPLDALLKATGAAHSGGAAKSLIGEGLVSVDGRQEMRKTRKLRAGQTVTLTGLQIRIHAGPGLPEADEPND